MNRSGIFILTAFTVALSGCDLVGIRGNGHITTEQRPVTEFVEIAAGGGLKVEWHKGAPSLSITADENLLEYVENRVVDNTLRLRIRERIRPTHEIKVSVARTS